MISKNEIKYIQTLYHKKTRDEENVFVAEGPKLAEELLHSNFTVRKIYALSKWIEKHPQIAATEITPEELEKISRLDTPNQTLAIIEKKKQDSNNVSFTKQITLALDGIQDPGNFGTIIRIADWFGIRQVIASEDCVDCYNPKTVQSTMGSIFRVNVFYTNLEKCLSESNAPVFGALLNGENVQHATPAEEGILVIGNESKGIRENILPYITQSLTIPAFGQAESLNAAVATGIILSHLVQR